MEFLEMKTAVRERRESFSASVEHLARWSGLSPQRIREIEDGSECSVSELGALSQGLAIDPAALLRGLGRNPNRSTARFRQAIPFANPDPADLRLIALAAEVGRIGFALAMALRKDFPIRMLREPLAVSAAGEPWKEGYRLGESARKALAGTLEPIPELEDLVCRNGVHVARAAFSMDGVEAASVWERESLPVIVLNTRSGRVRYVASRRAVLAHELCHLLHDFGEHDLTTQLTFSQGGNYDQAVEQRARGFAPSFVAPSGRVRDWARALPANLNSDPLRLVEALASQWGLSFEGAIWHAKNSQLINPDEASELTELPVPPLVFSRFEGQMPYVGTPPNLVNDDLPSETSPVVDGLIAHLAIEASEVGAISAGRASEILEFGAPHDLGPG